jgi:hypothetical protein
MVNARENHLVIQLVATKEENVVVWKVGLKDRMWVSTKVVDLAESMEYKRDQ